MRTVNDFERTVARMLGVEARSMVLAETLPRALARRARIRQIGNGAALLAVVTLAAALVTMADVPRRPSEVGDRTREVARGLEDGMPWTLRVSASSDGPCVVLEVNGRGVDCAELGAGEDVTVGMGYVRSMNRSVAFGALPRGSTGALISMHRGPTLRADVFDDPESDRRYWLRFLPRADVHAVVVVEGVHSFRGFFVEVDWPIVSAGLESPRPFSATYLRAWGGPGINFPLASPGRSFDRRSTIVLNQAAPDTCLLAFRAESCRPTGELGDGLQILISQRVRGRSIVVGLVGPAVDEIRARIGSGVYPQGILSLADKDPAAAAAFAGVDRYFVVDDRRRVRGLVVVSGEVVERIDV